MTHGEGKREKLAGLEIFTAGLLVTCAALIAWIALFFTNHIIGAFIAAAIGFIGSWLIVIGVLMGRKEQRDD